MTTSATLDDRARVVSATSRLASASGLRGDFFGRAELQRSEEANFRAIVR